MSIRLAVEQKALREKIEQLEKRIAALELNKEPEEVTKAESKPKKQTVTKQVTRRKANVI